jgi:hypothetical protein
MKSACCVLFLAVLAGCAMPRTQTLLVADYGYSLNGMKATELEQFIKKLRLDEPIALEACSCADSRLVTGAVDLVAGPRCEEDFDDSHSWHGAKMRRMQMKPNKRIECAPFGRPTRNSEAPLLAAHSQR